MKLHSKVELKESVDQAFLDARSKIDNLQVAFVDLNNLKTINDVFGHSEGDLVLQGLSEAFAKQLDPEERCFRFGGDEFVILLKSRTKQDLELLFLRIEKNMRFNSNNISSLSVGVVSESSYSFLSEVIEAADILMYEAKLSEHRVLVRGDKVTKDTLRGRSAQDMFFRDYFTSMLKLVFQTYPHLKDMNGVVEDSRAWWKAYKRELKILSPVEVFDKLTKHLPIERNTYASKKSD